jgi:hypothetical protein
MPLPVISVAQMREWENATWAAGGSPAAVIKKVGRASPAARWPSRSPATPFSSWPDAATTATTPAPPVCISPGRKVALVEAADPRTALVEFSRRIRADAAPRPPQAGGGRPVWHRIEPSAGRPPGKLSLMPSINRACRCCPWMCRPASTPTTGEPKARPSGRRSP